MFSVDGIDYTVLWSWFLVSTRISGLLSSLPGIGTNQVPAAFRTPLGLIMAAAFVIGGQRAALPANLAEGGLMIITEYLLGWLLGIIPNLVASGMAVAGQITTGEIGLGQANMIDPSLGEPVAILARLQSLITVMIFLLIDGHHDVIKVAAGMVGDVGVGMFRPDMSTAMIFETRFRETFALALTITGPVMVTLLLAQFVLGLLTKFVPQVNVFILSLPLTIGLGLFIIAFTFPALLSHIVHEFDSLGAIGQAILTKGP